jgi:DNA-binding transcriptional ArsR family regulator
MADTPDIAQIAALIGDATRAKVLMVLMADRALTATELAQVADVTKQTISAHLTKLLDAHLVEVQVQGRHRYFRLADAQVAHLIESLMGVAFRDRVQPGLQSGPAAPALRKARTCYDHLAGELAVQICEAMTASRALIVDREGIELSARGHRLFGDFGIDTAALTGNRRAVCRTCLDWSERRFHLAGRLGAELLRRVFELGWARRQRNSRAVLFTVQGERALLDRFVHGVPLGAQQRSK